MRHIIYDGDSFYELDEDCLRKKEEEERKKETAWQKEKMARAGKAGRRQGSAALK
ncbi:MAG: hypothetical protein LIO96_11345 [Lachnospiraceae bacterium]|nr:hypothetical protein [Lachnospiraceae bacterium]